MSPEQPVRCTYTVLLASSLWPLPLTQDVISVGREHLVAGLLMQSMPDALHVHGVDMRFALPALVHSGDVDCLILVYDGLTGISDDSASARHQLVQRLRTAVPRNRGKQLIAVVTTSMNPPDADVDEKACFVWANGVRDRSSATFLRARVCGFVKERMRELAAAETAATLEHKAVVPTPSHS